MHRPANTHPYRLRAQVAISGGLYHRLLTLRRRLEARYGIRIDDEDLIDYLCEKAVDRLEEWERRAAPR